MTNDREHFEWLKLLTRPARILLVEDDAFVRTVVEGLQAEFNCEVVSVDNGMDALALFNREKFDFVLLDLKLPGMDGMSVFRNIRVRDPQIPVVFMSGEFDGRTLAEIERIGLALFFRKPTSFGERSIALLLRSLGVRHIGRKRQEDEDGAGKMTTFALCYLLSA